MSLLRKKQKNAELAGANRDSVSHVSSSAGTRDESKRPPFSNQEDFFLSDLLLVSTTVAPDVLIIPAIILLCPLLQRSRMARAGCSSGGDVTTHLLSLPQTNGLWVAPFPFLGVKQLVELSPFKGTFDQIIGALE